MKVCGPHPDGHPGGEFTGWNIQNVATGVNPDVTKIRLMIHPDHCLVGNDMLF